MFVQPQHQNDTRTLARGHRASLIAGGHHLLSVTAALRRVRGIIAGSAAFAVLAGFAGAVYGAPAFAAIARVQPAATGLTWHKVTLTNGWRPTTTQGGGAPAWAVYNGIVYLSGSMHSTKQFAIGLFATLPRAARPATDLELNVYTVGATHADLTIEPDGRMFLETQPIGYPISDADAFTSLAGISYPAATTASHALALKNGWRSLDNGFYGRPSYLVRGGVVHLAGAVHQPQAGSDEFAVLPPGTRPARTLYISVQTNFAEPPGVLLIEPDGVMHAYDGHATIATSLAGVSFPVAAVASHHLTLRNGWKSAPAVWGGAPSYAVRGGVVYLSGGLDQPAAGSDVFGVLPKAARPRHTIYIKINTNQGTLGGLGIDANGQVWAFSANNVDAQTFSSLGGVSYPVAS